MTVNRRLPSTNNESGSGDMLIPLSLPAEVTHAPIDPVVDALRLTSPQTSLLLALADGVTSMEISRLETLTGFPFGTVVDIADRLAACGLVEQLGHPLLPRSSVVGLTSAGHRLVNELRTVRSTHAESVELPSDAPAAD